MTERSAEDQLDLDFLDALAGLFARLVAEGEQLAKDFAVPSFFLKALHLIDSPLASRRAEATTHARAEIMQGEQTPAGGPAKQVGLPLKVVNVGEEASYQGSGNEQRQRD